MNFDLLVRISLKCFCQLVGHYEVLSKGSLRYMLFWQSTSNDPARFQVLGFDGCELFGMPCHCHLPRKTLSSMQMSRFSVCYGDDRRFWSYGRYRRWRSLNRCQMRIDQVWANVRVWLSNIRILALRRRLDSLLFFMLRHFIPLALWGFPLLSSTFWSSGDHFQAQCLCHCHHDSRVSWIFHLEHAKTLYQRRKEFFNHPLWRTFSGRELRASILVAFLFLQYRNFFLRDDSRVDSHWIATQAHRWGLGP